jgi:uncharacterized protein with ParB-like and HNH nuclease domain
MKNLKTFEEFISTKIQEDALKAGEESELYIDDVKLDSGEDIKSAEILGSILAKSTEKEFKQYFYDEYGEGAFAEGEIDQLVKMYNDYKTEEAEKEKEEEGDAEGEGEEDDPLAGI